MERRSDPEMYHWKLLVPTTYWRNLHQILSESVPQLYDTEDGFVRMSLKEFYAASMILNNVRLIPKDHEMKLPEPRENRNYSNLFELNWDPFSPNTVIGNPEIATCANHRMQVLMQDYDFVACRLSDEVPISFIACNIPLEDDLASFFKALSLFQRTLGSSSLGIFDYYLEANKTIKLSRRYVASVEEYEDYWNKTIELNKKLVENRLKHYRCFWCYQTFIGFAAQGMSKGLLYDSVMHVPRAMHQIQIAIQLLPFPPLYISKAVCEELGCPQKGKALEAYNNYVQNIANEMETQGITIKSPLFGSFFEKNLKMRDIRILNLAESAFHKDLQDANDFAQRYPSMERHSRQEGSNHNSDQTLSSKNYHDESPEYFKVLLTPEGKVRRKIDPDTGSVHYANLADFIIYDKKKKPKNSTWKKRRPSTGVQIS